MNYKESALKIINERYEESIEEKKRSWETLRKNTARGDKKLFLFGCGVLGRSLYQMFTEDGYTITGFVDNNEKNWGEEIEGVKCISPQELVKIKNAIVFITVGKAYEVYEQLVDSEIEMVYKYPMAYFSVMHNNYMRYEKKEILTKIENLFDILEDEESHKVAFWQIKSWFASAEELNKLEFKEIYSKGIYLQSEIFDFSKKENLIDCGAYNGDTLQYFLNNGIKWNKYYAFEMSKNNYHEFIKYKETLPQEIQDTLQVWNVGVGEKEETIYYSENISGTRAGSEGNQKSHIVTLDRVIDDRISYIKMDIEGSEMAALRGGRHLIIDNKPKCAICAYHQPSDLWDIPLYLKELVPEYRVFFRHHDYITSDVVCYARIDD